MAILRNPALTTLTHNFPMNNPDSTPGPNPKALKSDSPATSAPPAAKKPWFEYDLPPGDITASPQTLAPVPQSPLPRVAAPLSPPGKFTIHWGWDFTLTIGGEEFPPNKGFRFVDFYIDIENAESFLRSCDDCFDLQISGYIKGRVRNIVLKEVAKVAEPAQTPKREVLVKLRYDIRVWAAGVRPYELRRTKEFTIKFDRQLRGHIMAAEYAFEKNVFSVAKAHFRTLLADWIDKLPPTPDCQRAIRQIKRDRCQVFQPDLGQDDSLPPDIEDIDVANPVHAG